MRTTLPGVRGRRLPDVFAARGRAPLPRGLPRPRAGWGLVGLGVVASLGAASAINTAASVLSVLGATRDAQLHLGVELASLAVGLVLTPLLWRATVVLTARWLRAEDDRRALAGPGSPPPSDDGAGLGR